MRVFRVLTHPQSERRKEWACNSPLVEKRVQPITWEREMEATCLQSSLRAALLRWKIISTYEVPCSPESANFHADPRLYRYQRNLCDTIEISNPVLIVFLKKQPSDKFQLWMKVMAMAKWRFLMETHLGPSLWWCYQVLFILELWHWILWCNFLLYFRCPLEQKPFCKWGENFSPKICHFFLSWAFPLVDRTEGE